MRIAIITFSDFNTNYGSMLQAFSLKLYLERRGHKVVFIRYREFNRPPKSDSVKAALNNLIKNIALKLYYFTKIKDIKETEANFFNFRNTYFSYTKLYTSSQEMKEDLQDVDWYLCGSDQIWNIDCLGGLRTPYFLDFAPNDKITMSYAASMGDYKLEKKCKSEFIRLLENLQYISVREKRTALELQKLISKKVHYVADPVFLNSKEIWFGLLPDMKIKKKYSLCYFVRRSKRGKDVIKRLNKELKIDILNVSDNLIYLPRTSSKYISVGPLEFLSLIKNAVFTIGTSFHLTAFSIIFNKPTLIIGTPHNQQRIENLLEIVDAKENFISEEEPWNSNFIDRCFQTKYNYKKLDEFINKSKKFLQLGEDKDNDERKNQCDCSGV